MELDLSMQVIRFKSESLKFDIIQFEDFIS